MIGKSANPFCFRSVKTKPIEYRSNKKAWMTSEIFEKWLIDLDQDLRKKRKKILLFLDNCSAHTVPNLQNIKVLFLPPNMTSHVEPMDMGIIKNLKHFYCKKVVLHLLAAQGISAPGNPKKTKLDVLQASRMLKSAWEEVTSTTIKNCFAKAGFFCSEEPEIDIIEPPADWAQISNGIAYEDFLNVDENVSPFGIRSDDDIVRELQNKQIRAEDSSEEEDEPEEIEKNLPTGSEALTYFEKVAKYVESFENVPDSIFKATRELESFLLQSVVVKKKTKKN